ncbi:MAG: hypothetical protein GEV10_02585 [Streptosporangiales bacterium]|nr:hypothetical protein [Streptosporangiales bacterium]
MVVPDQPGGERPEPLEEFVDELVRLRAAAGNPSFRRMAATSGAVSHATLHQTVTGNRLQPWETVREFVRACDGDEEALHEHWQRTHLALAADSASHMGESAHRRLGAPWRRLRRESGRFVVIVASVVVAACATAVAFTVVDGRSAGSDDERTSSPTTPPGPATPGDASRFIRDVTIPDGTIVKPGRKFQKVWEIQNAGKVAWRDRYLQRLDESLGPTDCRTPRRIPIGNTYPRERVKISVTVTAPSTAPADCMVRWKMVDRSGRQLFPSSRPVYFLVHVRK